MQCVRRCRRSIVNNLSSLTMCRPHRGPRWPAMCSRSKDPIICSKPIITPSSILSKTCTQQPPLQSPTSLHSHRQRPTVCKAAKLRNVQEMEHQTPHDIAHNCIPNRTAWSRDKSRRLKVCREMREDRQWHVMLIALQQDRCTPLDSNLYSPINIRCIFALFFRVMESTTVTHSSADRWDFLFPLA